MSEQTAAGASGSILSPALAEWAEWPLPLSAPPQVRQAVKGGRTNANFRLSAPGLGEDLLIRLHHRQPERLGIDRALEPDILARTAEAGIGRSLYHWDPAGRYALFPWLNARSWTAADMASPAQRERLWPLIERTRQIHLDRARRDYHVYLCRYWQTLANAGRVDATLSRRWDRFEPELKHFAGSPWAARLTHHDLMAPNVLDTGQRLVLIDWEYAAMGHPQIDTWSLQPDAVSEPFIARMMSWINMLWERLAR